MSALRATASFAWSMLKLAFWLIAGFAFLVDFAIPVLMCDLEPDTCQAAAEAMQRPSVILRMLGVDS